MEKAQHYSNGTWTSRDDLTALFEAADDDDKVLSEARYHPTWKMGTEYAAQLILFERLADHPDDGLPAYLVVFDNGDRSAYMTTDTYHDALDLVAKYAPAVSADLLGLLYNELHDENSGHPIDGLAGRVVASIKSFAPETEQVAERLRSDRSKARRERAQSRHTQ